MAFIYLILILLHFFKKKAKYSLRLEHREAAKKVPLLVVRPLSSYNTPLGLNGHQNFFVGAFLVFSS